jgi:DNA-binding transcriptional LysR family regulator
MDRLQTLTVFSRVAELESFTRAAESLALPKATVSTAVRRLEERVGSRLLQRTTRRVQLTRDGAMFYERCKDLLADADELEALFQGDERALEGRLRVDLPSRMARLTVLPRLPEFLEAHPGLFLELGSTERPVDLVREGYDCVVRVGAFGPGDLVVRRLGELPLINCASPGYLARHGTPRRLADLERHTLVHFVGTLGGQLDGWEYEEDGVWKSKPMRGRLAVNSAETYAAAALAGLGLIQAPATSLERDLEAGRLVEMLPRLRARAMPVAILYPHRRQVSRRVRVFMDWLAALLTALPRRG